MKHFNFKSKWDLYFIKCADNRVSAWCSSRNHLFIFNRTSILFVVLITFLSRLKEENVPIACMLEHVRIYKIPFISCIFVASSDMRFSCSYDWIYIYRNWIPRPFRDQRKSLFLHPKEMFASSSWCKHFLFGLRRRGKKKYRTVFKCSIFLSLKTQFNPVWMCLLWAAVEKRRQKRRLICIFSVFASTTWLDCAT